MNTKKDLSEQDIRTRYIYPALQKAGWAQNQIREEYVLTDGRIQVLGNHSKRDERKRPDYVLFHKHGIPIAVVEAKRNTYSVTHGIEEALDYARILDVSSAYSSNGDGFCQHDRTNIAEMETELTLDEFPSPQELWERYKKYKGIQTERQEQIATQDYFSDGEREPRYYQQIAVNRSVEAVAKGQNRILITLATGTGKTYAAFQIIHRLWKSKTKKRILFLADRNALIDQTMRGDFRHFKDNMTVIKHKKIDKSYVIYLALYQGLVSPEGGDENESHDAYREFSPDFFDLVVVDECHRGSAEADSAWRQILEYFSTATHIGLTATPKETATASSTEYFGDPIYTYSLKQGIDDGFLAPYKVLRIGLNVDLEGWRPEKGKTDRRGQLVDDREYNRTDFDKTLVIDERTKAVARRVTEFLKKTNRYDKTIIFCRDVDHAARMRTAIVNQNGDLMNENSKYVMRMTSNSEGAKELDNFINPEEKYPVIATTSKLLTTGIDAQTCKLIVLDSNIQSMTEFKQIIGRGTRINENYDKTFFTIMDFRNVTNLFADPNFDGEPVRVIQINEDEEIETGGYQPTEGFVDGENIAITDIHTDSERKPKYYVNGVYVAILNERIQYLDSTGKLITGNLKDYTRQKVREQYASLDDFLNKWNQAEKKEAIIDEFVKQGIIYEEFKDAINKEMDPFDLICHTAFDRLPLTRRERANNVKNAITSPDTVHKPAKCWKRCWRNMQMRELKILRI